MLMGHYWKILRLSNENLRSNQSAKAGGDDGSEKFQTICEAWPEGV